MSTLAPPQSEPSTIPELEQVRAKFPAVLAVTGERLTGEGAGLVVDYVNVAQKLEYLTFEAEPTGTVTNMGVRVGYFVTF